MSGGYTPARRAIAELSDGRTVFVKLAVDEATAGWLRLEHHFYMRARGPFLPELYGFEDGDRPLLVLEDLSLAHWPPAWRPGDVEAVCRTMEAVATVPVPGLQSFRERAGFMVGGWRTIAKDPAPFLSLGLASPEWLDVALPTLVAAEDAAVLDGDDLIHLDVRSDNMCFTARGVVLVDWNHACRGNRLLDIACWLPSLHAEGGPPPEAVLLGQPELAAWVSGFFAARAGLPEIPHAPRVRTVQRTQLSTALPWAIRALGLRALSS